MCVRLILILGMTTLVASMLPIYYLPGSAAVCDEVQSCADPGEDVAQVYINPSGNPLCPGGPPSSAPIGFYECHCYADGSSNLPPGVISGCVPADTGPSTTPSAPASTSSSTTTRPSTSCRTTKKLLHATHVPAAQCASQAKKQCADLKGKFIQKQNARVPNGCGPLGKPLATKLINAIGSQFRTCCNAHDLCFAGCNYKTFTECNGALYACAGQACTIESLYGHLERSGTCVGAVCAIQAQELRPLCLAELGLAETLISGQQGCNAFQDAQFDSCECFSTCPK